MTVSGKVANCTPCLPNSPILLTTFSMVPCRLYSTGLICTAAALTMVLTTMALQMVTLSAQPSFHWCEKWLAFFDDIGGELRPVGAADVLFVPAGTPHT